MLDFTPNRMEFVTTVVTYKDAAKDLHVILVRPDPRHRDKEGKSLRGENLPVGACQFIGGRVESALGDGRDMMALHAFTRSRNYKPINLKHYISASAVREVAEEISLDIVKYFRKDGNFSLIGSLYGMDRSSEVPQDLHYFNLHLGTLNKALVDDLRKSVAPHDDVIQALHVKVSTLRKLAGGGILIDTAQAHVATKTEFPGFPDMAHWMSDYKHALIRLEKKGALHERFKVLAELRNFIDMDANVRGLTGIDQRSLYAPFVGMYDPALPGVNSDGKILSLLLEETFGITLKRAGKAKAAVFAGVTAPA